MGRSDVPQITKLMLTQPSLNLPAAGDFATSNEMSAAYFIVKLTNNKYEVSSAAYYSSLLLKNILTGLLTIGKVDDKPRTKAEHKGLLIMQLNELLLNELWYTRRSNIHILKLD